MTKRKVVTMAREAVLGRAEWGVLGRMIATSPDPRVFSLPSIRDHDFAFNHAPRLFLLVVMFMKWSCISGDRPLSVISRNERRLPSNQGVAHLSQCPAV